jgi:hypothetical protein
MAHHMNLTMQTLSIIPLMKCIESLLQTLHAYFVHSPQRHLEFTKLAEIMETKGNKILCNVKTRWISMLSPTNRIMVKYRTWLLEMAKDNYINQQVNSILSMSVTFKLCSSLHPFCVATLTLGSRPRQGLARVRAKKEARESHFMLPKVQKNVREWTLTLPRELPLWELES